MPLILTVMLAGLFIELLGTIISVAGVSAMTGGNLIVIAFVVALDIGKIVTISTLYSFWNKLGKAFKTFGMMMIILTVSISSYGAFGYLSGTLTSSLAGQAESTVKVEALEAQLAKYEERKKQLDLQVANVPEKTSVYNRLRMINAAKEEQKDLIAKINAIEAELPALKVNHIAVESKAGPILAMAKTLDISIETAVKGVVGLLILVFNPFAVFLVTLANFLIKQANEKKVVAVAPKAEEVVSAPVVIAEEVAETPIVEALPAIDVDFMAEQAEEQVEEVVTEFEIVLDDFTAAPAEEVAEEVQFVKATAITPDINFEVDTLSKTEANKRIRRTSVLLDKALDGVYDGTVIAATPVR